MSTKPNIDRADYALLNAVALDEIPAVSLATEEAMTQGMNAPWHGLNDHELANHFFRLWDLGLIECSHEYSGPPKAPDVALAHIHFDRILPWPPGNDLIYRLTSAGGELWEYYSSPDWDKFYLRGTRSEPNESGLAASSRRTVELLLACPHGHPPPIQGTESWAVLQPWTATYWKTLPKGYEVTFRFATHKWPAGYYSSVAQQACEQVQQIWREWCKPFEEVCEQHFKGA